MKFLFSIVSKDDSFIMADDVFATFMEAHPGSSVHKTSGNKENITVVNNRMIESALEGGFDFLVMMHSDVRLDMESLVRHIEDCSGKYDVMGLCGCEKISISESPLNWFCGSRKFQGGRWGSVTHGELGNHESYFSADRPNVMDHAASCIDGFCMIMSRKAMESGLRFDENLKFNCYDTQISFDAVMKFGLKVGVLVERGTMHFSVGKSILKKEFLEDELVLRKRFGFDIPAGSKLEAYASSRGASV